MAKPRTKTTTPSKTRKATTPASDGTISRRRLLQSVITASVATTAAAALPDSAAPRLAPGPPTATTAGDARTGLTREQREQLTRVLNRLVPADGDMPGAGDIGVGQFIDDLLVEAPHLRRSILDVLAAVPPPGAEAAAALYDQLRRIEQEQPASFNLLLHATSTGYYNHPQVLDAIGWVPPDAQVARPEPADTTLLDAVRRRGPIYRNV